MSGPLKILIFGASYGSLLGMKAALAGHDVTLVCQAATAEVFNAGGAIVRLPIKGRSEPVVLRSQSAAGHLDASAPQNVDPARYDLVVLAMQEPQYAASGVRELLAATAQARVPCLSIMNMPPLPFVARLPGIDAEACRGSYTDPTVWDAFDPALVTLCSPDPQALRPEGEPPNVLLVRLATNFKAAAFGNPAHTSLLRRLETDIDAVRHPIDGTSAELPVKLRVSDSLYVPLAKWAMLLTGNYRCVQADAMRSISEAVHGDLATSRAIYEGVVDLCVSLGADQGDMVPFDKYADAARSLKNPSSVARALASGARNVERVDHLVHTIAAQRDRHLPALDQTVATVDGWLAGNRAR